MNIHEEKFESTPVTRLLITMSLPATIGFLVSAVYNMVDTYFVGRWVGDGGIAGLTISLPLQALVGAIGMGLGSGAASIVSRRIGEKRLEAAAQTTVQAFSLVFFLGALITVGGIAFLDKTLLLFGSTQTILPYAREYMGVILWGSFFLAFSMVGNNIYRAVGQPLIAMGTMGLGAILNIFLDPLFIYVFDMGIRGAAIATVISQFCSFALSYSFLLKGYTHLPLKVSYLRPQGALMVEIIQLGLPSLARQGGLALTALLMNNTLRAYGGDTGLMIYGIINRLFMFALMPIFGIVHGYQPIAGYSYGAKLVDRLQEVNKRGFQLATLLSLLGWAILMGAPHTLIGLFTKSQDLREASAWALRVASSGMFLLGFQVVGATYFLAIGKPRPALFLSLSRQFIFFIPLILIFPFLFGPKGVWYTYPVSYLFSTLTTMVFFLRSWKKTKKTLLE